ncbi:MAG: AAA family ATPase [Nitrospirae bacterium]|nr:AAA family ATPase [Nitrospirota bacterium]
MIESIEINGYKCFEELKLSGLRPVNVLVGRNAAGKTALLEAIRLALGATPTIAFNLLAGRGGYFPLQTLQTPEQFAVIWIPMFFDFDMKRQINFKITDTSTQTASLKLFFDTQKAITLSGIDSQDKSVSSLVTLITPLAFERVSGNGKSDVLYASVNQHGIVFDQGLELITSSVFFPSNWQSDAQVAGQFSQLSIAKETVDIIEIVRSQFPEIDELSIEAPMGRPNIYATTKHNSYKLPVSSISSGILKFISIMTVINSNKNGVVLIDEIENGIYYKIFPALWETLHSLALKCNTQIFLSTHSWEFLSASTPLLNEFKDDFSLIQLSQEEGTASAAVGRGEDAAAAIESGIEVRW